MTLREAIRVSQDDADEEIRTFKRSPQLERSANVLIDREYEQIAAAHLVMDITSGAPIWPEASSARVAQWINIAFRLGMRVQRKLDAPDKPSSMFDIAYDTEQDKPTT